MPPTPQTAATPLRTANMLTGASVAAVCILCVGGIAFFAAQGSPAMNTSETHRAPSETRQQPALHAFDALSLQADAAIVFDVRDKQTLYANNADAPLPLASITKLLTALVAQGALSPDAQVTIMESDLATEGDSGLVAGETWQLDALISFMLVTSSNDAATALKRAYEASTGGSFIVAMNTEAARLGMTRSQFANETGLDIDGRASNTGSARDAALLLASAISTISDALDPTRHEIFTFTSLSGIAHRVRNTNELADDIPWAVGAKTGFTDSAGGNLAVSFDASIGRPVAIVVLGSSKEGRFSDVRALVDATLQALQGGSDATLIPSS